MKFSAGIEGTFGEASQGEPALLSIRTVLQYYLSEKEDWSPRTQTVHYTVTEGKRNVQ